MIDVDAIQQRRISTHAPRTGSDLKASLCEGVSGYFNPRSPHGERHQPALNHQQQQKFQPTLPARGATVQLVAIGAI